MRQYTLLVLSPLPEQVVELLFRSRAGEALHGQLKVVSFHGGSREELIEKVSQADLILGDYTNNVAMDAGVLGSASRCLLIQQPSTGYQHIDAAEAGRLGIPVANVAGANALSVAEHTIMVILALLKKLFLAHAKTENGGWAQDEMARYGVFELYEKVLGVIGAGMIGKEVLKRAKPFGPRMIYYDIERLPAELEEDLCVSFESLDDLISESDIVTVHAPLTPETEGLVNAERIGRMKPNSIIVNVSRGAIVDEEALAAALKEGRVQGAAIDVFSTEPIRKDNPLLNAPNVILTPHIAGATNESRMRIINLSMDNIVSVMEGRAPVNVVNGVMPGPGRGGL